MKSVAIHPPKTPVNKGSGGIAKATLPNVCKMPGPPAPFVPAPLPNIAKSELSPQGYSTTVEIDGNAVAIRGAMFESMGDMASKGTGGGLISANCHGPAKFITPGSMTVKIEGKAVHLLGEPMLNNCGPSGSPPNTGATMMGVHQYERNASPAERALQDIMCKCDQTTPPPPGAEDLRSGERCRQHGILKHECCENAIAMSTPPPELGGEAGYDQKGTTKYPTRAAMEAAGQDFTGLVFPDACAMTNGQPTQFFDFKFPCKGDSDGSFYTEPQRRYGGLTQYEVYLNVSKGQQMPNPPKAISSRACRP